MQKITKIPFIEKQVTAKCGTSDRKYRTRWRRRFIDDAREYFVFNKEEAELNIYHGYLAKDDDKEIRDTYNEHIAMDRAWRVYGYETKKKYGGSGLYDWEWSLKRTKEDAEREDAEYKRLFNKAEQLYNDLITMQKRKKQKELLAKTGWEVADILEVGKYLLQQGRITQKEFEAQ